jgi:protein TonB
MRDGVAEVLAQRARLDRGAGGAVALSLLLHGGLTALAVYAALHATPPKAASMVNIQFAKMPAAAPAPRARTATPVAKPVEAPKIEPPKPKIEEPKPAIEQPKPAKVEKNTVPLSPFGKSTKKGSETPQPAKPAPAPAAAPPLPGVATTTDVPIGGAGVTGLEGGDFPYTLYIQGMQRRIGTNWFRPQVAPGTATLVYFRILRDGTIAEARVETSSGNGTFDRAALGAVRSSSPLNPLPFAYDGNYLGVHLTFR